MPTKKGNFRIKKVYRGANEIGLIFKGNRCVFVGDELKPKYFYNYGDGGRNSHTRHTGTSYGTQLFYVRGDPINEGNVPFAVTLPVNGGRWGRGTEGNVGGDPFNAFTSSGPYVNQYGYSDISGNTYFYTNCDDSQEYTCTYWGYTDEGRTSFGNIWLKIDNKEYTINEAIKAQLIKPIVPIALYGEMSGTTFDVGQLLNGKTTIANQDDYCYHMSLAFMTTKKHQLQYVRVGGYKEGCGFRCFNSIYGRITLTNNVYRKSQYVDSKGKAVKYW